MGSICGYVTAYILGGLTFIPLLLALAIVYVYLTLPLSSPKLQSDKDPHNPLRHEADDGHNLKTGTDLLAEEFRRTRETDVAAGYFAILREYSPDSINGRPPEKSCPPEEVTGVAKESPSVYQAMYRSIFDRRQAPTIEPVRGNGKNPKKMNNVFYVILR